MRRLPILLLLGALAGCAGGASQAIPSTSSTVGTSAKATTTASFTIAIPAQSAQAKSRQPQYVSTNTQSVIVTLTTVNGSAFTGAQAETAVDTSTCAPSCTITVPAAVGTDVFTVNTYDAQQTSTSPATATGDLLSSGTVSVNVVAGQANTSTAMVLNGVPASITAAFATDTNTTAHVSGSETAGYSIVGNRPYTLTFSSKDASGATIVGDGAPTLSSGSSAVSVAQSGTCTSSPCSYTVQVKSYSSSAVTLSASTPSGTPLGFTVTTVQELWEANNSGSVIAYGIASAPGQVTATQVSADTVTAGLAQPIGLAFDSSGNLWVSDQTNNTVTEYVPGSNTVVATINLGASASPTGLAFDANGNLWVAEKNADIIIECKGAVATGTAISSGPQPYGLTFDASGNLWVASAATGDPTVTEYTAPQGSSSSPAATISSGLTEPEGLAFDANGDLWVTNFYGNNVREYAPPLNASSSYVATISSLNFTTGVAIGGEGNVYVAQFDANSVAAFAPPNVTTPISGTPFTTANPQLIAISP